MGINTMRFSGIASGLDTDSIVKALLGNHKLKIDNVNKQKTVLDWKKDAWKEMNTKISAFNTKYVDKLRIAGTYLSTKATVSNENAISVKMGAIIPTGTHEISNIGLAKSAIVTGEIDDSKLASGDKLSKNTKLSDLLGTTITNGTTITLNAKTAITITADETIGSLETKLKKADPTMNINFDITNKKLFMSTKSTGDTAKITMTGTGSDIMSMLVNNPKDAKNPDVATNLATGVSGAKATYNYNGVDYESQSNDVTINGFDITLKQATTEKISITSSQDTDSTVKLVKEFIEEYNKLMEDINTKLDTKKSRTYTPLTDEQKEKMTDKEIEKWEDKVKGSLFYRDSGLTQVRDMLRDQLAGVVNNGNSSYKVLSDIGITTGKWQENGKLYLDEVKLTKALQEKPNEVISLLTASGSDAESKGIFNRISEQFTALTKSTDLRSYGSFYNDKVDTIEGRTIADNILKYQDKYDKAEKMYYAKFTAMEKAMSQLNSQGSALTSMLGQSS